MPSGNLKITLAWHPKHVHVLLTEECKRKFHLSKQSSLGSDLKGVSSDPC